MVNEAGGRPDSGCINSQQKVSGGGLELLARLTGPFGALESGCRERKR
jgi:hypothetical protein